MDRIAPISRRSRLEAPLGPEALKRRKPSEEEQRKRKTPQPKAPDPPRPPKGSDGRHIDVRA